jgi:hypothetical protein
MACLVRENVKKQYTNPAVKGKGNTLQVQAGKSIRKTVPEGEVFSTMMFPS